MAGRPVEQERLAPYRAKRDFDVSGEPSGADPPPPVVLDRLDEDGDPLRPLVGLAQDLPDL